MSKLTLVAAVVVGTCAVLAATGFRGRQTVVGIDLGTTYSVIAVNEIGKITVLPDRDGSLLLPSVVSFLDGGRTAVGEEAVSLIETEPGSTIYGAKRFIGRRFDDRAVGEEASEHQFKLVRKEDDLSEAWFEIRRTGHSEAVSPQVVGSYVLRNLLGRARSYLGHSQVDKAVIAVPAKFDGRQREATSEAFDRAGLKVIRMLEEPTAAALAFGLHRKPDVNHILVYDFGGGTLDVSLLFVNDGAVDVIGSDGDDYLGGSDFDQCVAHLLERKLGDRETSLEEGRSAAGCRFDAPACALHNLYHMSEGMRHQLTDGPIASDVCMALPDKYSGSSRRSLVEEAATEDESLASDSDARAESSGGRGRCDLFEKVRLEVTRTEYEQECAVLFDRGVAPVDRLLSHLDLESSDIDEVVMVGGMTRTPRIRDMVKEHLGITRLNVEIDPDVVVAYGAATVAH